MVWHAPHKKRGSVSPSGMRSATGAPHWLQNFMREAGFEGAWKLLLYGNSRVLEIRVRGCARDCGRFLPVRWRCAGLGRAVAACYDLTHLAGQLEGDKH